MSSGCSFNKSLLKDPFEISLVFDVSECKSCTELWPFQNDVNKFGVFPSFDFKDNFPAFHSQSETNTQKKHLHAEICECNYPKPSVLSGCRKAPILFLDVNPQLANRTNHTNGAFQAYPHFSNENDRNELVKYAYYYRYCALGTDYINLHDEKNLIAESCIYTQQAGMVEKISIDLPRRIIQINLKYVDGSPQVFKLNWNPQQLCYHVFVAETEEFAAGTLIAARLNFAVKKNISLHSNMRTRYRHLQKILTDFTGVLHKKGHTSHVLTLGEDMSFLHLLACATPAWYLDLFDDPENDVIQTCVKQNEWVLKQLVQSQPAVIFLNGDAAYKIFCNAFCNYIHPFIPAFPADRAFRLFWQTCDLDKPYYFEFSGILEDEAFQFNSRIVVLPDIQNDDAYLPQIRLSERNWTRLEMNYPNVLHILQTEESIAIQPPSQEFEFYSIMFNSPAAKVLSFIRQQDKSAHQFLLDYFYHPYKMVNQVLRQEMELQNLLVNAKSTHLLRSNGVCHFCQNRYWKFPAGCSYEK